MMRLYCIAFAVAAFSSVNTASAQSVDTAYCSALASKYQRYVGDNDAQRRSQIRDARFDAAVAQCQSNSAAAIPVLEKALKDAKVDLPLRN
jgi:hypothetical protein